MTNDSRNEHWETPSSGPGGWLSQLKIPWFVIVGLVLAAVSVSFYVEENIRGRAAWERFKRD